MNKKLVLILIIIALIGGVVYYYEDITNALFKKDDSAFISPDATIASLRELSETITYAVPGGSHVVAFSLYIDDNNTVQGVKAIDLEDPSHKEKLDEFSATLIAEIQGKKLSELEAIDKVGTASLTTDAFNEALATIQTRN